MKFPDGELGVPVETSWTLAAHDIDVPGGVLDGLQTTDALVVLRIAVIELDPDALLLRWSPSPMYDVAIETWPMLPRAGVKMAEHVPLERIHEVELKAPGVDSVKETVPIGIDAVPLPESETLAVQRLPAFTGTVKGVQTMDVVVGRLVT